MRYLLDTHTFLWWCAAEPKLSVDATTVISNSENVIYVSAVSAWEIAIKSRLGKLPLPSKPDDFMSKMLQRHAFSVLEISMKHTLAEYYLPIHHHDPFDRLLIAQASLENMTLISNDKLITKYQITTLW